MATSTAKRRLLPIGIQDFPKIREGGFVYVDKTARIYELLTGSGGAFFLSRPRRFGKSLLCSTLGAIFEGRRELFGEIAGRPALAMDSLDWEWKRHPVIRIDLNAGNYGKYGVNALHDTLSSRLRSAADKYGITLNTAESPASRFMYLIEKVCDKVGEKAVVVIDEYDKPLTGTLSKRDIHIELRSELKAFYGVLKSYDAYLRFILLTGVSKFSHVSIFSDLNQLKDLTLNPVYADLCGLTQEELEANFEPEINDILENTGRNSGEYMEQLRRFYNGYRFSEAPITVYNPSSLYKHFDSGGDFFNSWYESGTPSFLVNLLEEKKLNITDMNDMMAQLGVLREYELESMTPAVTLYQSGYLTITGYNDESGIYTLDFPNEEVRASFAESLMVHSRSG
jgi:hypothetical protein